MEDYVIEMLHITKDFPGIRANDDITLQLKRGEIHALLGENGAGKSTLMSVLFGLYQPDGGEIRKDGKPIKINNPNDANALGIGMVHQHFKLVEIFTVLENIMLGVEPLKNGFLDKAAAREKIVALSDKYGLMVDPDAVIEDVSVGMQQRVEILKMLYRENDILIFDEPTAVLTPQEIDELMAIMKGYGVIEPTVSWGWMEKEIPEPGPFEALCSPVAVLPCTSDVHSAHFRNAWPNRILGHEGVGRVEKVGAMVTDIHVGDIVAVPAVTPIWRGRQIAEGLHEHTGGFLGGRYLSSKLDGTFGEYFIIPDADMNLAVVPNGVSIKAAGLVGDMVTTGFSGVEGANIQFGDTVVVIGIGPVGLMSVAGAAIRGAGRLIAVGHRELTKELAKKYGATDVVDYKDGDIVAQIMELTNNEKVDRVIIAGGTESTINDAYRMVKCGGNISNVAGYDFSKEFHLTVADAGCLVNHVTLTGRLCAGGRYRLENLMALIKNGRLDPTLLITHELHGFDKIEDGFRMMDERKTPDTIKPIVII